MCTPHGKDYRNSEFKKKFNCKGNFKKIGYRYRLLFSESSWNAVVMVTECHAVTLSPLPEELERDMRSIMSRSDFSSRTM